MPLRSLFDDLDDYPMTDPLEYFRSLCVTPRDAVRWACVLEATAPKAGNVYPGKPFSDLTYADFITSAEIAAEQLGDAASSMASRILEAVRQSRAATGSNVNLGILLLLGPLVAADQTGSVRRHDDWPREIARQLDLGPDDSRLIFRAIREASAGGLGTVDDMDVNDQTAHDDIIAAMCSAQHRDRVALQYAGQFSDLINNILPLVYDSMVIAGDLLRGISVAHLRLLALGPDTLIARKCGPSVAREVQQLAAAVDASDAEACRAFDRRLRGH